MSTMVHALRSKIGTLEKQLDELLKRVESLEARQQIVWQPLLPPIVGPSPHEARPFFGDPSITIGDDPHYVGPTCSAKAGL